MRTYALIVSATVTLTIAVGCATATPVVPPQHEMTADEFLKLPHFLPDDVFIKIYRLVQKYSNQNRTPAKAFESTIQREMQALYCDGVKPRFSVKYTINFSPQVPSGLPLDGASSLITTQGDMAKYFFRNDFLYASGGGSDLSQYLLRRSYRTGSTDLASPDYISASTYRKFTAKNKQRSVDMEALLSKFTFHIPKAMVTTLFVTADDDFKVDRFGFSQTGEFAPSEAIAFKDYIWRYTLKHDTQVLSAPADDGSYVFEMKWTPTLYCRYGVPISDLEAK